MPPLGPLVLGMFTDVEERSTAMEARGFGSTAKRTTLTPVRDSAAQRGPLGDAGGGTTGGRALQVGWGLL
ncbi:MAG: hypothetical protein R2703_13665 [Micropruina glycogenica]